MPTVREITFKLLQRLNLTHVVANPGSTEEHFLAGIPDNFSFTMALQEASVVGIADGLAQGLNKPVLVNLHTSVGVGNAMGCIITAFLNKTPLIITAGQQTREMLLMEPFLTNRQAIELPKPWVKWSYEVMRPEDVPAAFMRAYTIATQAPTGPVFLSIPMDLWNCHIEEIDVYRQTSTINAPEPHMLHTFAQRLNQSKNPVVVVGGDIARSGAWNKIIQFAERVMAPVWKAPFCELAVFPQDHPLYQGELPPAKGILSTVLMEHDLVLVIGAPVFRYYPWTPGDYLARGSSLMQIIDDPYEAAKSPVGDCLISDSRLALQDLLVQVQQRKPLSKPKQAPQQISQATTYPLAASQVFELLATLTPEDYLVVHESPSNTPDFHKSALGKFNKPNSYYFSSSGCLGWAMPAAVGLALAEQEKGAQRPVLLIIGDGSFQYSVQAIWTAVQQKTHLIMIALCNEEYAVLKAFAHLEKLPRVPGLDLPNLDLVSIAKGYGAQAYAANTIEEISMAYTAALNNSGVSLIQIAIDKTIRPLLKK